MTTLSRILSLIKKKIKPVSLLWVLVFGMGGYCLAQPPNINYGADRVYTANITISTLTPTHAGGPVPANAQWQVTTLAGSNFGFADGQGAAAQLNYPTDLTIDKLGNIYVADSHNNRIRKVTPQGVVTTVAGSSGGVANGPGNQAKFDKPKGLVIDNNNNIWVTDTWSSLIRKIDPLGVVTTFAGNGNSDLVDGIGSAASFYQPRSIAIDKAGNLYVADQFNNCIRKITPAGVVTTFAGDRTAGSTNGQGSAARFDTPSGIAVNSEGTVFVADAGNHKIRTISPQGVVTDFAGNGINNDIDGTGTQSSISYPISIFIDKADNLYVVNGGIRKITPWGQVTTIPVGTGATSTDGIGYNASLNTAYALVIDDAGDMYVAEFNGHKIRKLALTGGYRIDKPLPTGLNFNENTGQITGTPSAAWPETIYTITARNTDGEGSTTLKITVNGAIAPPPSPPDVRYDSAPNYPLNTPLEIVPKHYGGDVPAVNFGNAGTLASINKPLNIATDARGNFYVADISEHVIYKITAAGQVSPFAGKSGIAGGVDGPLASATFNGPSGIAFDSQGNMYVAENLGHRIRKITPDGTVSTLAGDGAPGNGNGSATTISRFRNPYSLIFDDFDNLYITDMGNNAVRKITPIGDVSTLASHPTSLLSPQHIAKDFSGNLYVSSSANNTIRKISPSGSISTYAGLAAGSLPGLQNIDAPNGLAMTSYGELFFTGRSKNQLFKIKPDGTLSIISGNGTAGFADGPGTLAQFNEPMGITLGVDGNVYIADSRNNKIRTVIATGFTTNAKFPTGITFNPVNGKISGTPTKGSALTDYTVIAYNAGGVSTATVTIGIEPEPLPAKPDISYSTPQTYSVGIPIQQLKPVNNGDKVPETIYGEMTPFASNLNYGQFVTADRFGDVYTAEWGSGRIKNVAVTPYEITAGPAGAGVGKVDGPADKATFYRPMGVITDRNGNIYVAEEGNNRIRKISSGLRKVTTLAGNDNTTHVDAYGTNASFSELNGITIDPSGNNLYVADRGHGAIRKINLQTDQVTTVNTGPLFRASGVDVDAQGNLYIANTGDNSIKKVSATGDKSTIVAALNNPRDIRVDGSGNIYVSDQLNNCVKRISADGQQVTTVLSNINQPIGLSLDGRGYLYIAGVESKDILKMCVAGYTIDKNLPAGLVFDARTGIISGTPTAQTPATTYTITAYNGGGSSTTTVSITVNNTPTPPIAGQRPAIKYPTPLTYTAYQPIADIIPENTGGAVPATNYSQTATVYSPLNEVNGLTVGPDGFIYVCESGIHQITKIDPVTKLPVQRYGSGAQGTDDGNITIAKFSSPYDVAIDAAGNMYLSDLGNNSIRKISAAGVVTTLVNAAAGLNKPKGLAIDATGAFLYVADEANNKVRKIATTTGQITDVNAGPLIAPADVALDKAGNLYIANTGIDAGQGSIIKVDPLGSYLPYVIGLTQPRAIQVDELGDNVYVNSTMRVNRNGDQVLFPGSTASAGLALDGKGLLYFTILGGRNLSTNAYNSGLLKSMVVTGYVCNPSLPNGLTFDAKTGVISGSPQPTGSAFDYKVTAFNVSGSSTFTINMRVNAAALTPQVITFPLIAAKIICNAAFAAGATSDNASLPIKYTSSNTAVAEVDANTGMITLKGIAGTALITASQPGNANYSDAAPKQQTLTVTLPIKPIVKINDNRTTTCVGSAVKFDVVISNSASIVNPGYQWLFNGLVVSNNNTATYSTVVNATDVVKCIVTNNDICTSTGEDAVTGIVTNQKETLALNIESSATGAVCVGTSITFTAKPSIANTQNHYQWLLNGANTGSDSPTYTSTTFKDGDVVSCMLTVVGLACVVSPNAIAINPVTVRITAADSPAPTVTILAPAEKIYAETAVSFTATTTNTTGQVNYQWKVNGVNVGSNSASFTSSTLKNADKVTCVITTGNCNPPITSNEVFMNILPPVTIIPANAFTPNGDGINDVWLISGLSTYPNCLVNVYNRQGQNVFQSKGYSVPWGGVYNAKVLPVGTYYYVIDLGNGKPKVSGYLTIVR